MSTKVVVNTCYGGFSLSEGATALVEERTGEEFDAHSHPRHCPVLVSVVEELGEAANGECADLAVLQISGRMYIIREYDGTEWVQEPEDIRWVTV